jgi:hypothetical protein
MAKYNGWRFGGGHTSNGSVGFGGGINGVPQSIYSESELQRAPLGTKLEFDDGRVFRYTYAAAAVAIANLCANDYSAGLMAETDDFVVGSDSVAGSYTLTLTGASADFATTANAYAGSYIVFSGGTGAGQYFRISDHNAAASDKITFNLFDAIVTAPAGSTDFIIVGAPYGAVITCDGTSAGAATDSWPVGVSPIAITSTYYFWMQTKGICAIKADYGTTAAPYFGQELVASANHNGQVEAKTDALDGVRTIGSHVSPTGDDNTFISMYLDLE